MGATPVDKNGFQAHSDVCQALKVETAPLETAECSAEAEATTPHLYCEAPRPQAPLASNFAARICKPGAEPLPEGRCKPMSFLGAECFFGNLSLNLDFIDSVYNYPHSLFPYGTSFFAEVQTSPNCEEIYGNLDFFEELKGREELRVYAFPYFVLRNLPLDTIERICERIPLPLKRISFLQNLGKDNWHFFIKSRGDDILKLFDWLPPELVDHILTNHASDYALAALSAYQDIYPLWRSKTSEKDECFADVAEWLYFVDARQNPQFSDLLNNMVRSFFGESYGSYSFDEADNFHAFCRAHPKLCDRFAKLLGPYNDLYTLSDITRNFAKFISHSSLEEAEACLSLMQILKHLGLSISYMRNTFFESLESGDMASLAKIFKEVLQRRRNLITVRKFRFLRFEFPPLSLVRSDPETLISILSNEDDEYRIHTILSVLKGQRPSKLLAAAAANSRGAALSIFHFIGFFESLGLSEDEVIRIFKIGMLPTADDLLINKKTGRDLSEFRIEDMAIYKELFETLRKAGQTQLEGEILGRINFDKFAASTQVADFFSYIKSLSGSLSDIHPGFKTRLYRAFAKPVFERHIISDRFKDWLKRERGKHGEEIDVTKNNIAEINAIFDFLGVIAGANVPFDLTAELSRVFTNCPADMDFSHALVWLAGKLDVEEISNRGINNPDLLESFLTLQEHMLKLQNDAADRYLGNSLVELDFAAILEMGNNTGSELAFDLKRVEAIRLQINSRNHLIGDQIVDRVGTGFLERTPASYGTIKKLLDFARAWLDPQIAMDKDVKGLYSQFGLFAYAQIADLLQQETADGGDAKKWKNCGRLLAAQGVDFDELVAELEKLDFVLKKPSDLSKAMGRFTTNPGYVIRRGMQKLENEAPANYDLSQVTIMDDNLAGRKGVASRKMMLGGRELAKVFVFDPKSVGVKVLAERSGIVDTDKTKAQLGRRYIFSAPMTMTSLGHKMTELAFRDGQQMNYLTTPRGKDGLLLASPEGKQKVIDKQEVRIADLIDAEDLKKPEIEAIIRRWCKLKPGDPIDTARVMNGVIRPFRRIRDRSLFLGLLQARRWSVLSGMLLIGENKTHYLPDDGQTSRRFFVEFGDGKFGIVNSTEDMSTASMTALAQKAGAKRAIYMDTGMYDMAEYCDGSSANECQILGHQDTNESTNRVVIYEK